ncbi:hypothetical protein EU792_09275, partial [Campylobacter upsaliensis]|nr:hypothetical protein [Campylobacter upsaliensis]
RIEREDYMVVALVIYCSQVLVSLIFAIVMLFFFFKMTGFDEKWNGLKYKGIIIITLIIFIFTLLLILRYFAINQ